MPTFASFSTKHAMKIFAPFFALCALLLSAVPALAQTDTQSSPQDRQRFVTTVRNLERAPLDSALQGDRAWAIQWLTDAPDVSVTVCAGPIGGLPKKNFAHGPEITVQYMLGMAVYAIETPVKANDPEAQQVAGVESALRAYQTMRAAQPGTRSPELDKLIELQSKGELPAFVRKAYAQCKADGARK